MLTISSHLYFKWVVENSLANYASKTKQKYVTRIKISIKQICSNQQVEAYFVFAFNVKNVCINV